jgi:hypothetical protein
MRTVKKRILKKETNPLPAEVARGVIARERGGSSSISK